MTTFLKIMYSIMAVSGITAFTIWALFHTDPFAPKYVTVPFALSFAVCFFSVLTVIVVSIWTFW